jgi:serine phosphatase RsbU (regulator of sigma subunit)
MVTDGITEAKDGKELWGKEGLLEALPHICGRDPEGIADGILEAAKAFCGGNLHDDAAIVILRVG